MKKLVEGVLFESSAVVRSYIVRFPDDPEKALAFPVALERVIDRQMDQCQQKLDQPTRYAERTLRHCAYMVGHIGSITSQSCGPDCTIDTPHGFREETTVSLLKQALKILDDVMRDIDLEDLVQEEIVDALDAIDAAQHDMAIAEITGTDANGHLLPPDLLELEGIMAGVEQRLTIDDLRHRT